MNLTQLIDFWYFIYIAININHMIQKTLYKILLISGIMVIVGGVVVWSESIKDQNQSNDGLEVTQHESENINTAVLSPITSDLELTKDESDFKDFAELLSRKEVDLADISNWKTHRNDEYKYELKIPNYFNIEVISKSTNSSRPEKDRIILGLKESFIGTDNIWWHIWIDIYDISELNVTRNAFIYDNVKEVVEMKELSIGERTGHLVYYNNRDSYKPTEAFESLTFIFFENKLSFKIELGAIGSYILESDSIEDTEKVIIQLFKSIIKSIETF